MGTLQRDSLPQKCLFGLTLILMGLTIFLASPMALAVISFLSLITLTLDFDLFNSTSDKHLLNRADFILQVILMITVLVKFLLLARPTVV